MSQLPLDHTGQALHAWHQRRPDLDLAPAHAMARMRRLMSLLEPLLEAPLARFGLNHSAFDTLSALRRNGPPYHMTASELATQCLRTQATLTTRIARLERDGLVTRSADPDDGRAVIISLTDRGLQLIDEAAPTYLETERLLLTGLDNTERDQLAQTLQRLLLTFEGYDTDLGHNQHTAAVPTLGIWLESLHRSIQLRRTVGLPDQPGMIVVAVDPDSPAQRAGLTSGDLLVAVGGSPARSVAILNQHLDTAIQQGSEHTIEVQFVRQGDEDRTATVPLPQPAA
ncbi:MarR family transcriptional regulator [Dactylosporangium sp. CA-233914]|uniref:MarR family transcriptional regulator n=1 Tax=Dactylosporangium sp. CA-233914 TaxID=3239934 RepID=UPI003D934B27